MENTRKRLNERVEELIQHYQNKADELKRSVEDARDSDSTITVYKWMHSLWSTCCSFVADLDELATHCEVAEFVENCEDCGFCNNNQKEKTKMIIKKYAEATVDESVFYGKVEVETENKNEWENIIRILETAHVDDGCVCHCNVKENAELVAKILDADVENKVFSSEKKMTKADLIRSMCDEDLAWEFMQFRFDAYGKAALLPVAFPDTQEKILEWLKQPIEHNE